MCELYRTLVAHCGKAKRLAGLINLEAEREALPRRSGRRKTKRQGDEYDTLSTPLQKKLPCRSQLLDRLYLLRSNVLGLFLLLQYIRLCNSKIFISCKKKKNSIYL